MQPDEWELISRIREGDPEAEQDFVRRWRSRLESLARVFGVRAADCADPVQEVLFEGLRQIRADRFRQESTLTTWLAAILRHRVVDYWRRHGRLEGCLMPLQDSGLEGPQEPAVLPSMEVVLTVREVLASLPQELRALLVLNAHVRLTTKEIATLLKMPAGTVGRKLAEAKEIFRRRFCARSIAEKAK